MAAIKHVHIYVFMERRKGVDYYKCDDPHCTHMASRKQILNKASVCSNCKRHELILTWRELKYRRPKCLHCANTEAGRVFRAAQDVMAQILKGGEKKAS